jgi:predicted RNase H-like nuclease
VPLPKNALEGRIQRQLVLHQQNIDLPDPMDMLKRITPQRLLEGAWPLERLYSQGELDALVAAYTAWQAATHPEQTTSLGDASEGVVILPVAELKRRY